MHANMNEITVAVNAALNVCVISGIEYGGCFHVSLVCVNASSIWTHRFGLLLSFDRNAPSKMNQIYSVKIIWNLNMRCQNEYFKYHWWSLSHSLRCKLPVCCCRFIVYVNTITHMEMPREYHRNVCLRSLHYTAFIGVMMSLKLKDEF